MSDHIHVQPAPALRTEFARYVVAADPHTRMAGGGVFRVRRGIFTHMPEALLDGALIGGTLYQSVADGPGEDATQVTVGELGPETVLPVVADTGGDALSGEGDTPVPDQAGLHVCTDCDKVAASAAGLAAHRRAKHEGE